MRPVVGLFGKAARGEMRGAVAWTRNPPPAARVRTSPESLQEP